MFAKRGKKIDNVDYFPMFHSCTDRCDHASSFYTQKMVLCKTPATGTKLHCPLSWIYAVYENRVLGVK